MSEKASGPSAQLGYGAGQLIERMGVLKDVLGALAGQIGRGLDGEASLPVPSELLDIAKEYEALYWQAWHLAWPKQDPTLSEEKG